MQVLFTLVALLVSVQAQECTVGEVSKLFPTARQSESPEGVDVCQWYAPNSCCNLITDKNAAIDDDFSRHVELSIDKIDGEYCENLFHQAFCTVCHPLQDGILQTGDRSLQVTLCADFCEELYTACSYARWVDTRDAVTSGYGNAAEFCGKVFEDHFSLIQDDSVTVTVTVATSEDEECASPAGSLQVVSGAFLALFFKYLVW